MVLVDTSVWVSHFREGNAELETLLNRGGVLCHPFIVGELACGNLKDRAEILYLLRQLPRSLDASHDEVIAFIEINRLMGKGIGFVDVALLASAVLSDVPLWTLDKRLAQAADALHAAYHREG